MNNKPSFLGFRSRALANLTLDKGSKKMSKTEQEDWVRSEYERHYGEVKKGTTQNGKESEPGKNLQLADDAGIPVQEFDHSVRKVDHVEVSDGATCIVSSKHCPLTEKTVYHKSQLQYNTICCKVEGQFKETICPCFYKAVLDQGKLKIDCRR